MIRQKKRLIISKNIPVSAFPADLIETVKQKLGDEFLWSYDSETKELFITKRPPSITDALYGLKTSIHPT